jgi:hypothetical protein
VKGKRIAMNKSQNIENLDMTDSQPPHRSQQTSISHQQVEEAASTGMMTPEKHVSKTQVAKIQKKTRNNQQLGQDDQLSSLQQMNSPQGPLQFDLDHIFEQPFSDDNFVDMISEKFSALNLSESTIEKRTLLQQNSQEGQDLKHNAQLIDVIQKRLLVHLPGVDVSRKQAIVEKLKLNLCSPGSEEKVDVKRSMRSSNQNVKEGETTEAQGLSHPQQLFGRESEIPKQIEKKEHFKPGASSKLDRTEEKPNKLSDNADNDYSNELQLMHINDVNNHQSAKVQEETKTELHRNVLEEKHQGKQHQGEKINLTIGGRAEKHQEKQHQGAQINPTHRSDNQRRALMQVEEGESEDVCDSDYDSEADDHVDDLNGGRHNNAQTGLKNSQNPIDSHVNEMDGAALAREDDLVDANGANRASHNVSENGDTRRSSFEGSFKQSKNFERRKAESDKMKERYNDRLPVICEKSETCTLPDIDRTKYLVGFKCKLSARLVVLTLDEMPRLLGVKVMIVTLVKRYCVHSYIRLHPLPVECIPSFDNSWAFIMFQFQNSGTQ